MIRKLTYSKLLAFALIASVASLALAFTSQYRFGLTPCELCVAQRVPYGIVILLSIIGLIGKRRMGALALLIGLCFLLESGIASYHTAVEQHWVRGPEACTSAAPDHPLTMEEILAKIKGAPIVACDQPQWEFHGITMATLNALWALALTIVTFVAVQHIRKKEKMNA